MFIASYVYLVLAIILEIVAVVFMKKSESLTVLLPSIGGFLFYALSFTLASFACKKLDVGFVYATWSSVAIIGVFVISFLFFGEHINALKAISAAMIVVGVIGFSLAGASS